MKQFSRILLLTIVAFTGCHHERKPLTALPVAPAPVPPPPSTPPQPTELPAPPPIPQPNVPATPVLNPLDEADGAFNAGNYVDAAHRYEKYLQTGGERRDEALYRMALSLALTPGNVDWARVTTPLKQLVDQYPESPFKPPATLILSLTADAQKRDQRIKQLTTELDKLKQIDADRRKRP